MLMKLCNQTIWDNTDFFASNFLLDCKTKIKERRKKIFEIANIKILTRP